MGGSQLNRPIFVAESPKVWPYLTFLLEERSAFFYISVLHGSLASDRVRGQQ